MTYVFQYMAIKYICGFLNSLTALTPGFRTENLSSHGSQIYFLNQELKTIVIPLGELKPVKYANFSF